MYLAEKNRIDLNLKETLKKIEQSSLYFIVNLTSQIVEVARNVEFYELHDRMILATAKWLEIPIISSDKKFNNVPNIECIWK